MVFFVFFPSYLNCKAVGLSIDRPPGKEKVRVLLELEPGLRWLVVDIRRRASPFTSPGSDITRPPFSIRENRTMQQQGIVAVHFFNLIS